MGWNIYLAAIEDCTPETVVERLGLDEPDAEEVGPNTLPFGEATNAQYADDYVGVGTLGDFTLVTSRMVRSFDHAWKKLSKKGRVVVFWLSENIEMNCLDIYQVGECVLSREQDGRTSWKAKPHPLEKGTKAKDAKADHIARVFANLTKHDLFGTEVVQLPMRMHPAPRRTEDRTDLETLRARLDALVAEPLPESDPEALLDLVDIKWFNRRRELEEIFDLAWDASPETAAAWGPELLAAVTRWPEAERKLPRERYDRIAKGKDDGRSAAIAALYRRFEYGDGNDVPAYREKPFVTFLSHPIASELRSLAFDHSWLPSEAAVVLAGAARLTNLSSLSVLGTEFGSEGIAAIARAPVLAKLRALDASRCHLSHEGFDVLLAEATFAPTLEVLALGGNELGASGMKKLARASRFKNLRELRWTFDDAVDADALRTLLASPVGAKLRRVDISDTGIGERAVKKLAAEHPSLVIVRDPPVDEE
ncbi:MAG: hypothetical protein SFX73_08950 [Kofleriaceae bacterium]|nr:hypothetical protein [Kofleriaceae bacterium]